MDINIPTSAEVRARLAGLGQSDMQALAEASKVPFTTLLKIKNGVTENPRIETVRQFWGHLTKPKRTPKKAEA